MTELEARELDMKTELFEREVELNTIRQFVALGGTCERDGNMFGAVIGDFFPEACAAFEETRMAAITACMHNFHNEKAVVPKKKGATNERS